MSRELEEWRPVRDFEGLYEVSDHGRVRSLRRRTRSGYRGGRLLTPYLRYDGYHEVSLQYKGNRTKRLVHHLVLEAFDCPRPDGTETLHGPGGKAGNHLASLRWGTRSQNMGADRVRDGQSNRGERHGQAKLTWADVCEIRRLLAEGTMPQYEIAELFGVCRQVITNVKYRKSWAHPPEEW